MKRALAFEPRSITLAVGRSLVAVAELVVVVFTPDADLFLGAAGEPPRPRCDGLSAVSLWCVGSPAMPTTAYRFVSIAVLLLVASGYRPRWTCIPHWYVTFSLSLAAYISNGGEQAARLLTLLLIPLCIGDCRRWQWQRPDAPLSPTWRGVGYAGHLAIRGQVVLIYGDAVIGKLREPEWLDGTAMHYIFQSAYFGAPSGLMTLLESRLLAGWSIPTITWTALAAEAFIAFSAFGNQAVRRWALAAGVGLHGGIVAALGLISFGLVMIALLAVACSDGVRGGRRATCVVD